MKTLLYVAAALLAGSILAGEANALPAPNAQFAKAAASIVEVRYHRRRGKSLFRNWCAYNCYAVPPCYDGPCLGRYGYSRFAYDEDLPFPYRYDSDAIPTDNAGAFIYRFTGAPIVRAFERVY